MGTFEEDLREKIANIDFCWNVCGEIANTCQKQIICAAFEDRHNSQRSHAKLDYRKADQIFALIKEALPELAKEAGYMTLFWDSPLYRARCYDA